MNQRLQGKVAVITGAASGIGLATLELFVQEGARIVAADREIDAGHDLERRFPGVVHFAPCDVMQLPQLQVAIDSAAKHFGGLDILFNNAGSSGTRATVETFDAAGWDDTMALLLRAVAAGTAYAMPHMVRRGGGAIVNTASISAVQAGFAPLAYSVAKAGVLQYTKVASSQLSAHGIRINAVAPGFVATRIFGDGAGLGRDQAQAMADQALTRGRAPNPLGHTGQPIDIAHAVLFLVSDAAAYITGTHLVVDGGSTIGPRHSWDPSVAPPMVEALGLTPEQTQAMFAAKKGDA
jgi:NAD(P)-dependent dehydrogenase (short-subunit alcohol dehydrogenase family)